MIAMGQQVPHGTKKPKTQRQRFIDTARELGCDESEEAFDAALKKIGSAKVAEPKAAPKEKS
jgi:hypothetical protein